ncbi:hypothetical protein [Streptomyces sp. NPDC050145]|uniref:hypothetical protein n=1 Tax=Streptomyces sp. NPDC050145 TaxID=3365602 RepID=UPI0037B1E719
MSTVAAADLLRGASERTGITLEHVSQLLVDWERTGRLCSDLRAEIQPFLPPPAP